MKEHWVTASELQVKFQSLKETHDSSGLYIPHLDGHCHLSSPGSSVDLKQHGPWWSGISVATDCNGKEQVKCTDPNTHIWNLLTWLCMQKGAGVLEQILKFCHIVALYCNDDIPAARCPEWQQVWPPHGPPQRGQITFTTWGTICGAAPHGRDTWIYTQCWEPS